MQAYAYTQVLEPKQVIKEVPVTVTSEVPVTVNSSTEVRTSAPVPQQRSPSALPADRSPYHSAQASSQANLDWRIKNVAQEPSHFAGMTQVLGVGNDKGSVQAWR